MNDFMKLGSKTRKDFMLFSFFPFIDKMDKEHDFMKLAKDLVLCDREYLDSGEVIVRVYAPDDKSDLASKIALKFINKFNCNVERYSGTDWYGNKELNGVEIKILGGEKV